MTSRNRSLYQNKSAGYFENAREDLIAMVPANASNKILEVGAAGGYTPLELKRRRLAAECVGIELFELPGTAQKNPRIDRLFIGNIETDEFELEADYFDVIICGDVLEHLTDPWANLEKICQWLKPGGVIIISSPNFRNIKVLWQIFVKGRFDYQNWGILDKAHLRFFCKPNIISLAKTGQLKIQTVKSDLDFVRTGKAWLFNRMTFGLAKDFLTTQYITRSVKIS